MNVWSNMHCCKPNSIQWYKCPDMDLSELIKETGNEKKRKVIVSALPVFITFLRAKTMNSITSPIINNCWKVYR